MQRQVGAHYPGSTETEEVKGAYANRISGSPVAGDRVMIECF
jgi:hypothetical protein